MDSLLRSFAEEKLALSLFNQYDQVFRQSLYSDHTLAAAAVDSMQLLISQKQSPTEEAQFYNRKGSLAFLNGDYDNAHILYKNTIGR